MRSWQARQFDNPDCALAPRLRDRPRPTAPRSAWLIAGSTRFPVRRGKHWLQAQAPSCYEPISDAELIDLCFPISTNRQCRWLLHKVKKVNCNLSQEGDLRIVEGNGWRLLPPAPGSSGTAADVLLRKLLIINKIFLPLPTSAKNSFPAVSTHRKISLGQFEESVSESRQGWAHQGRSPDQLFRSPRTHGRTCALRQQPG